jgi:hypothetical protein
VKITILLGAIAVSSLGCAATGMPEPAAAGVESPQAGDSAPVRAGEVRVLDPSINPLAPIHLAPGEGDLTVRFGRPRDGAVLHLDPESLEPIVPAQPSPRPSGHAPSRGPSFVPLSKGRYLVCWKRGDALSGYRLMAQAWTTNGAPMGPAVAVSPADIDVVGAASLVAVGADRAVATFAASAGDRFELLAVPLEVL